MSKTIERVEDLGTISVLPGDCITYNYDNGITKEVILNHEFSRKETVESHFTHFTDGTIRLDIESFLND